MARSSANICSAGVHEFVFGGEIERAQEYLDFWETLGFLPIQEGAFSLAEARAFYHHESALHSIRLKHSGCDSFQTGYVRLQLWDQLRNQGLGNIRAINCGSRWMGLYTHDVLQLHDSFAADRSQQRWGLRMSPVVNAALQHPPPEHDFDQPFVGLRELLVFGNDFRLAFIQRAGFDRPGFGTFDDTLPFKNTEGSHANVVQPANAFSTEFYKTTFDLETAPFGEAHDSGDEPSTIEALDLTPGELFHIERIRAQDCPSGLLQIYSSYKAGEDYRDLSRPGSRNLCAYSMHVTNVDEIRRRIVDAGGDIESANDQDEFGQSSLCFNAPDGYCWIASSYLK